MNQTEQIHKTFEDIGFFEIKGGVNYSQFTDGAFSIFYLKGSDSYVMRDMFAQKRIYVGQINNVEFSRDLLKNTIEHARKKNSGWSLKKALAALNLEKLKVKLDFLGDKYFGNN